MLYIGPIILKSVLSNEAYVHFLTLSVSIRILCDKNMLSEHLEYAESLLKYFVKKYKYFYGEKNVTYNVHNLIHLANDARRHGTLDEFSAFKFENYMSEIKKLLKNSGNPLLQIANRLTEKQLIKESLAEFFRTVP